MNSDELKHNEVPEARHNGEASNRNGPSRQGGILGLQQPHTRNDDSIDSALPVQSDALRVEDGSRSVSATKSPSRRALMVGAIIAVVIVAGLLLGFLPRWRQSRSTAADTSQLAIPTVSVVSPASKPIAPTCEGCRSWSHSSASWRRPPFSLPTRTF